MRECSTACCDVHFYGICSNFSRNRGSQLFHLSTTFSFPAPFLPPALGFILHHFETRIRSNQRSSFRGSDMVPLPPTPFWFRPFPLPIPCCCQHTLMPLGYIQSGPPFFLLPSSFLLGFLLALPITDLPSSPSGNVSSGVC